MSSKPFARHDNVRVVGKLAMGGGGLATVAYGPGQIKKTVKVALAGVDTAAGVFAFLNNEVGPILVNRVTLDVTTVANAAGTVSVGSAATATSSANLIDTLDVRSATGVFDNIGDHGTLGKAHQKVAAGAYVTGSKASGALAGLVGSAYIEYTVMI